MTSDDVEQLIGTVKDSLEAMYGSDLELLPFGPGGSYRFLDRGRHPDDDEWRATQIQEQIDEVRAMPTGELFDELDRDRTEARLEIAWRKPGLVEAVDSAKRFWLALIACDADEFCRDRIRLARAIVDRADEAREELEQLVDELDVLTSIDVETYRARKIVGFEAELAKLVAPPSAAAGVANEWLDRFRAHLASLPVPAASEPSPEITP